MAKNQYDKIIEAIQTSDKHSEDFKSLAKNMIDDMKKANERFKIIKKRIDGVQNRRS